MTAHKIAVIPGDGIGNEVVPQGLRVLEIAASRFGIDLAFDHFDFASCDYYARHGTMMPADWKDRIGGHDAIYFGAVGWPEKVPDHISLWGSLLLFRREFDQYVNLRPVRLIAGVPCPLVGRKPGTPMVTISFLRRTRMRRNGALSDQDSLCCNGVNGACLRSQASTACTPCEGPAIVLLIPSGASKTRPFTCSASHKACSGALNCAQSGRSTNR